MDRRSQLKNVAFGGGWSQAIPRRERYEEAVSLVRDAPSETCLRDLRNDGQLNDAVHLLCQANPKGEIIQKSWDRALGVPDPGQRSRELIRIVRILEMWVSD